jgi:hypothetical protein
MRGVSAIIVAVEKTVSIIYYECVYVAVVIQHAVRMTMLLSTAFPLNNIFPHYHTNGTIFEKKKLLNIKRVF